MSRKIDAMTRLPTLIPCLTTTVRPRESLLFSSGMTGRVPQLADALYGIRDIRLLRRRGRRWLLGMEQSWRKRRENDEKKGQFPDHAKLL